MFAETKQDYKRPSAFSQQRKLMQPLLAEQYDIFLSPIQALLRFAELHTVNLCRFANGERTRAILPKSAIQRFW